MRCRRNNLKPDERVLLSCEHVFGGMHMNDVGFMLLVRRIQR